MTEAEWNDCAGPTTMLIFLEGKTSDRKFRMFAVACCRKLSFLLNDERSHFSIEVAERYANGKASEEEREAALEAAKDAYMIDEAASDVVASALKYPDSLDHAAVYTADVVSSSAACVCATVSIHARYGGEEWQQAYAIKRSGQAALLRCIIGPSVFRPITVNRVWATPTVTSLAEAIYQERAFDRLPILADALEDGGCNNHDILNHCRKPGSHVRGCWVVDLLLNKA